MTPPFTVMGVVNVTPDSFSDGGEYLDAEAAVAQGLRLAREGAAVIDVGGESTRPGADPVPAEEELRRVVPVVEGLAAADQPASISIDTTKRDVARAALDAGARDRQRRLRAALRSGACGPRGRPRAPVAA